MGKFFTAILKGIGSILGLMGLLILGTFILFFSKCSMNMADPGSSTSADPYLYLFGGVGILALIMVLGVVFFTLRGIFRYFKK